MDKYESKQISWFQPDSPGDDNNEESEADDSLSSRLDLRNENQKEDISFDKIHDVLTKIESPLERSDENRRLVNEFRTKPLDQLKMIVNGKNQQMKDLLNDRKLSRKDPPLKLTNGSASSNEKLKLHTNNYTYPELFTY
ncbi:unnamed protein product [Rotaria magnacalcarata]|uniref:Uncharacterized protein n=1 Tax=Rotaria magnacalcarata TaxID=392030 RepID=A0A819BEQ4_9BILA|nr:unnamed protein product [Rotaria magnacalcarata]CAF1682271.1 unnamed protein product [Rotaria magnacalcarata]CAF2229072.1 unnamed protein product [Rotaria magnacalcarata]CAF3800803.1 unnamed protein product [Rotaria magnacalcarata]CAF4024689.1 unnamed protein product [Rotaria magnacalcarata]